MTIVVLGAVMVKAVAEMVVDYTTQARVIDRAVTAGPSGAST